MQRPSSNGTNSRLGAVLAVGLLALSVACTPPDSSSTAAEGSETAVSSAQAAAGDPQTEEEKLMYFLGVTASRSFDQFLLSDDEKALVLKGLGDALGGTANELDPQTYGPQLQELARERQQAVADAEKEAAQAFLDEQAKEPGAQITESGLIFTSVEEGEGASPTATDTVRVHYHGTLRDGEVFDSSVRRGTPASFPLNRVIPCWTEGVAMMKVGGKANLVCPAKIAYGERGSPGGIPGGAALKFEVELLEIVEVEAPAAPAAPTTP